MEAQRVKALKALTISFKKLPPLNIDYFDFFLSKILVD